MIRDLSNKNDEMKLESNKYLMTFACRYGTIDLSEYIMRISESYPDQVDVNVVDEYFEKESGDNILHIACGVSKKHKDVGLAETLNLIRLLINDGKFSKLINQINKVFIYVLKLLCF